MKENECYKSAARYCACVEFRPAEDVCCGFSLGQLIAYTLGPNRDAENNKDTPQSLDIAFSTADVLVLGRHLERLADGLRENELAVVRALPGGSGKVEPRSVFVASIKITPIEKK
jgi:hypothetical protein